MEQVNCNLCGSTEYKHVYRMPDVKYYPDEWFQVVECRNCGLGYVNPRPTKDEIGKYYPKSFYSEFEENRDYHLNRYKHEANYLKSIKGENKRLLDIGCANGDFPRFMMKLGWEVEGVETSLASKEITDFKIYKQEFSKIPILEPKYDAITAWAVMEHVHDPMAYFKKASEVLKDNGLFIFLVTNFNSISSRYLFREDIPRHLYFFTEDTVKEYLKKNNFELLKIDYTDKIYQMNPLNLLRFLYITKIKGQSYNYDDVPLTRIEYFNRYGFKNNLYSNIKYILLNPLTVTDRILMPLFSFIQVLTNKYGIVVYVARKCQ